MWTCSQQSDFKYNYNYFILNKYTLGLQKFGSSLLRWMSDEQFK
jgi:hypothetical protein